MKKPQNNAVTLAIRTAEQNPQSVAFLAPTFDYVDDWRTSSQPIAHHAHSWDDVASRAARLAAGLASLGLKRGDRVVILKPMCVDFYVTLAAVQRLGAVAVVVESWGSIEQFCQGARHVKPRALVGCGKTLMMAKHLNGLPPIEFFIGDDTYGIGTLEMIEVDKEFPVAAVDNDDTALITFTTGSSGIPKGANRTHGFLRAQAAALAEVLRYPDGAIDLCTFPIFGLNNAVHGNTTVLPAFSMANAPDDAAGILLDQLRSSHAQFLTTSPALLRQLCKDVEAGEAGPQMLERVVTGGAPFSANDALLIERTLSAKSRVLYGSTEVEPISIIDGEELIATAEASGIVVGKPVDGLTVQLIRPMTTPLAITSSDDWQELIVDDNDFGEVVVAGEHVCRGYYRDAAANARTKIVDVDGTIWHRTGDVGQFDTHGRLQLIGRIHSLVRHGDIMVAPWPIEGKLRALGGVREAAVVETPCRKLGARAIVVISLSSRELNDGLYQAVGDVLPKGVDAETIIVDEIPMDPRHRSKVDVDALKEQLAQRQKRVAA